MRRSTDNTQSHSPQNGVGDSVTIGPGVQSDTEHHPSNKRSASNSPRSMPSVSFLLFTLAIIAAGSGALAWALVRPEPRTVEILIPTPGPLTIHVTGEVANPGVYTLPAESRVEEAVAAAGGLTGSSSVNLAAPLRDGQQLVITEQNAAPTGNVDANTDLSAPVNNLLLDLNAASGVQLEELPGIGPARAGAIIEFRDRNGPILFADDLTAIDGIGQATVDSLRSMVIQP